MNLARSPRQTYKAMLFDYDELLLKSDEECCYSLSYREVQLILAQLDYITWKTRYRPTSTEIDQNVIDQWNGELARKLMSGCCPDNDELHRYLEDGTYQTSTDGGETWEDDPTGDPRYGAPLAPPLSGSDGFGKRCAAADNVRQQYEEMRDGTIGLLTSGTTALLIVSFLVGLLGGILSISVVGVSFGVMLFALAGYLLSLTPESVGDQLDASVMEEFKCLVYCNMGNDGRLTDAGLSNLLTDIATTFDGFPETFFYSITASLGATGISNAATMGTASASDCDDCECDPECLSEDWIIIGTLVSQTINTITIEAEQVTNNGIFAWWIRYGSMTVGAYCCTIQDWESSPSEDSSGHWNCDGSGQGGQPGIEPFNMLEAYRSSGTWQLTLTFAV